jgi:hypothetical protein
LAQVTAQSDNIAGLSTGSKRHNMCVLHVKSKTTSFANFVKTSGLPFYQSHERGDLSPFGSKEPYDDFGFSCKVSDKSWTDGQVEEAVIFLHKYENELCKLVGEFEVNDIRLDFMCTCRLGEEYVAHFDYFPAEIVMLAGKIGIGIELSHYIAAEDKNVEPSE